MQICFREEKFRSASKENADPFYCEEKFRSAPKEDANPFYFKEKELFTCKFLIFKKETKTIADK